MLSCWDAMKAVFGESTDACMLEYVNLCVNSGSYFLPVVNGGYKSRKAVECGFEACMKRALDEPKLTDSVSGRERDRRMAALAIHLYPELSDERQILKSVDLSVEHVFGRSLVVSCLPDRPDKEHRCSDVRERSICDLERAVLDIDDVGACNFDFGGLNV